MIINHGKALIGNHNSYKKGERSYYHPHKNVAHVFVLLNQASLHNIRSFRIFSFSKVMRKVSSVAPQVKQKFQQINFNFCLKVFVLKELRIQEGKVIVKTVNFWSMAI